jgi:Fanconi anemia group M protein
VVPLVEKKILKAIIDDRERKLMKIFDNKKGDARILEYEAKRLSVADIVVSERVGIERKEGFDFVSSIMDNRLFEQILRLKEAYPEGAVVILEGLNDDVFENTGMKISSIYGALSFISYKLGISVIPTRNIEDTAIVIERIAYREQVKDDMPLLSRVAPKGMDIAERRYFIVEGLVDIGPKKAKLLVDTFQTPYNVFRAIRSTKITYTKTGNPKGIEGPLKELKGFGWKFVKKNKEIILGLSDKNSQKRIDEI